MKSINPRLTASIVTCMALLAGGCATSLDEASEYELQASLIEKAEQIEAFIYNCEASGNVVMYTGPSTHRLRDPIKRIPRHARPSDYTCTSSQEIERFQAEMGLR